jgi:glc operon protein GlcG
MEDSMLTLSEAKRIIDGGIAKARELRADISIAVCDVGGHLIALNRMDNAQRDVDRGSIGKAIAAAVIGRPSEELAERLMTTRRYRDAGGKMVTPNGRRGGLPIIRGDALEGACGVCGAPTNEQDEECARAGIAVLDAANWTAHKNCGQQFNDPHITVRMAIAARPKKRSILEALDPAALSDKQR